MHRDVAALAVGDHEQAARARVRVGRLQREPAGGAEPLEAGELGLDRDAGGAAASISARSARGRRRPPPSCARPTSRPGEAGGGVEPDGDCARASRPRDAAVPRGVRTPGVRARARSRGRPRSDRRPPAASGPRRGDAAEVSEVRRVVGAGSRRRLLDGRLEPRAGGEPRHLGRRDVIGAPVCGCSPRGRRAGRRGIAEAR